MTSRMSVNVGAVSSLQSEAEKEEYQAMPRSRTQEPAPIEVLIERVQRKYFGTPLAAVGEKLSASLAFAQNAVSVGALGKVATTGIRDYVERAMELLPGSFGARFHFDASMIQAICAEWEGGGRLRLSQMIVPRYRNTDWGYQVLPMQPEDGQRVHVVKLVDFPGTDTPNEIDLLDYPFLLHELGHELLYRPECKFRASFSRALGTVLDRWRLRSISDRAAAKARATRLINQVESFWTPNSGQHDWAHEVGVDLIGLWTAGPAYLDTLNRVFREPTLQPYVVLCEHPPYAVRAAALIAGADRLGWGLRADGLRAVMREWERKADKAARTNAFATSAAPEIVTACVESAHASCRDFGLPLCDQARLERVGRMVRGGQIPEVGIDLILGAWIAALDHMGDAPPPWEAKALAVLIDQAVTPETL